MCESIALVHKLFFTLIVLWAKLPNNELDDVDDDGESVISEWSRLTTMKTTNYIWWHLTTITTTIYIFFAYGRLGNIFRPRLNVYVIMSDVVSSGSTFLKDHVFVK